MKGGWKAGLGPRDLVCIDVPTFVDIAVVSVCPVSRVPFTIPVLLPRFLCTSASKRYTPGRPAFRLWEPHHVTH